MKMNARQTKPWARPWATPSTDTPSTGGLAWPFAAWNNPEQGQSRANLNILRLIFPSLITT